jgi:two-component system C4-dicarboxylate transport response regulator DctD
LLEKIRKFDENIPVIVISGIKEVKIVVEAIKKGTYDYITKPNDREIENEKRICQTYSNNNCFIVRYYFNFW